MEDSNFKYLVSSEKDVQWGIVVDTIGSTDIPSGYDIYPPLVGHPTGYYFNTEEGRILDSYQLIYISRGRGTCYFTPDEGIELESGSVLVIPPYTWHSYFPDKKTGWQEYWIGLQGDIVNNCFRNNFIDPAQRVYKVGFCEEMIEYYNRAQEVAFQEKPCYQQVLAGIAHMILSLTLYHATNRSLTDDRNIQLIEQARAMLRENYLKEITPQQVAGHINMSYSWFRKMFKEYTDVSPAQYVTKLKLQTARTLLLNSNMNIKQIAYYLNYEDALYFSTLFKKHTGYSPSIYRDTYSNMGGK